MKQLTTQFTKYLNVHYPIIQAGMAGSTTPELVAAVSHQGGLGTIGAGYFDTARLEQEIQAVQALTSEPFAVNLFIPSDYQYSEAEVAQMNAWLKPYRRALQLEEPTVNITEEQRFNAAIDLVLQYHMPVCSFTFGIPNQEIIERLKAAQIVTMGTATSVDEAIAIEQAGIDIVIAQGSEAGGHRSSFLPTTQGQQSMIGTMALVPQIVDHVDIPVIAAGGIMDGRGILASLILGASGVQMGTAFLTLQESGARPVLKQAILNSKETDTVVTNVFSGKYARGINNNFIQSFKNYNGKIPDYPIQNQLTTSIRQHSAQKHNDAWTHLWSGQAPRLAIDSHVAGLFDKLLTEIEALRCQF